MKKNVSQSMEDFLLGIIRFGTCLILFTPLVVHGSFLYPAIFPKVIFFRILADILLVAYIFLAFPNPRYQPKFNPLTVVTCLFFAILILTSIRGVNFARSFWSHFERMGGLLTFLHIFAFFIIVSSVFKERRDWEKILTCSVIAGAMLVFSVFLSKRFSLHEGAAIGNSSFMAAYLLFDIFFAVILFLLKKGRRRIFYGVILLILITALLSSEARGAIISFLGGIFLLVAGYSVFLRRRLLQKALLAAIIFLIISAGALLIFHPGLVKNKLSAVLEYPTIQARFIVWQISWQGWKERFWLGWGPENFQIPFARHFDPHLILSYYGGEYVFDRAHNIIFDTAVTSGLLGLIGYLLILSVSLSGLFRVCRKSLDPEKVICSLGTATLLITYFAQNLLIFDMINTYIMFFLTLAFTGYLLQEKELIKNPVLPWFKIWGVVLIAAALITLYFGNIQPTRASWYLAHAQASPLENAIPLYQKALKTGPESEWETAYYFAERVSNEISLPGQNKEILENGFLLAEEAVRNSITHNPLVFHLYLSLGRLYNASFELEGNADKLALAEKSLREAIRLSPKNPQGYWELAQARIFQGRHKEAFDLLQEAIDLEPRLPQSHWHLVTAFKMAGQEGLAQDKIRKIEKAGLSWKGKFEELKMIIAVYQGFNDYSTVSVLCQEGLRAYPKSVWLRETQAAARANLR